MNIIISNKFQPMLESLDIDVIKSLNGEFEVDEIIRSFENFYFQRMILDITAIKDYKDIKNIQKLSISLDMNKIILLLDDSPECTSSDFLSKLVSIGIYNFTKNAEGIMYLYNTPNSYRDVAHIQQLEIEKPQEKVVTEAGTPIVNANNSGPRILGIKGVTKEAGATTLTYLFKKELESNYSVAAIEVDKRDFIFFKDKDLISSTSTEIGSKIVLNNDKEVIVVDINGSKAAEDICHDVIYLIEPSVIKLNRLMIVSSKILKDLSSKKVILNKSLLSSSDVHDFEYESGLKIIYNMPPINDREGNNPDINKLLLKLGFDRQNVAE